MSDGMMVLLHGLGGMLLAWLSWRFFAWRAGGQQSMNLAPVIVGLVCASFAHTLSPWATPLIVGLYALSCWHETRQ